MNEKELDDGIVSLPGGKDKRRHAVLSLRVGFGSMIEKLINSHLMHTPAAKTKRPALINIVARFLRVGVSSMIKKQLDTAFAAINGGKAQRRPAIDLQVGLGSMIEKQLDNGLVPLPGG